MKMLSKTVLVAGLSLVSINAMADEALAKSTDAAPKLPQPKFLPPTMMSPACTRLENTLSMSSMQCDASSLGSVVVR